MTDIFSLRLRRIILGDVDTTITGRHVDQNLAQHERGHRGEVALVRVVVGVHRESNLFQVVGAGRLVGRRTDLLNGRQQEGNENPHDGDHDEQFDERKAGDSIAGAHDTHPIG